MTAASCHNRLRSMLNHYKHVAALGETFLGETFIWKKREMGAYMEERNGCINGVLKDE